MDKITMQMIEKEAQIEHDEDLKAEHKRILQLEDTVFWLDKAQKSLRRSCDELEDAIAECEGIAFEDRIESIRKAVEDLANEVIEIKVKAKEMM